jgi:hypothetical protein
MQPSVGTPRYMFGSPRDASGSSPGRERDAHSYSWFWEFQHTL